MIVNKISKATGNISRDHFVFGEQETEYFFQLSSRDFEYNEYFVNFETVEEKNLFYMIFSTDFFKDIDENLIKLNEISIKQNKYKNDFSRTFRTFQQFIARLRLKTGLDIKTKIKVNGHFKIDVSINKLTCVFRYDGDYELISKKFHFNPQDLPEFFELEELVEMEKNIMREVYRFGRYQKNKT